MPSNPIKATLTLPFLPSRDASPNGRVHWRTLYQARHKLREDTFMVAMSQQIPSFKQLFITLTYVVAQNRRRDIDNYTGMAKGILDGLVDAHVLRDDSSDCVKGLAVKFLVDKERAPATIVEIKEVDHE